MRHFTSLHWLVRTDCWMCVGLRVLDLCNVHIENVFSIRYMLACYRSSPIRSSTISLCVYDNFVFFHRIFESSIYTRISFFFLSVFFVRVNEPIENLTNRTIEKKKLSTQKCFVAFAVCSFASAFTNVPTVARLWLYELCDGIRSYSMQCQMYINVRQISTYLLLLFFVLSVFANF